MREDEWYNFTAEPQNVHVLLKLDENTYEEQDGSAAADDHPIAWCSNYDGGRHFYTALGHKGSYWSEPAYLAHIRGAIEWAAGEAPGDCGPDREGLPTDASFDKVTLDDTTENPMEIAVDADGSVFYVELAGKVKHYDAATRTIRTIGTIPVHRGNENGLLGITLDPDFEHEPLAVPLLQRARARGAARLPLHRRRRRHDRHGVGEAPAADPAPADHLLPLVRLADLRARRQPLHLGRRRHAARGVAGLQPDRRPPRERAGRQPGRRPRARRAALVGQHERPARQDPAHHPAGRRDLHDPGGQPVRPRRPLPGGGGQDPARDLHDGPPQPVPDPGRPGDGLALQRRGRPGRGRRERQPRPARLRRAQPDPPGGQHGLAVLHRRQQGRTRTGTSGPRRTGGFFDCDGGGGSTRAR